MIRTPSIYFLREKSKQAELEAEHEHRLRAGLDVRWLNRTELRREWGIDAECAICSSHSAQVDPYDLTHALLTHAVGAGALVYDRTRVTDIVDTTDGVVLRTDRGPSVCADFVIRATGYEAAAFLPRGMVHLQSTYACATEPLPAAADAPRCIMWEYADPYLYARWIGDRLLLGGEDEPFKNAARRDRLIGRKAETLIRRFRTILPDIMFEPAFAWTGTFGTTGDGLGYIGPLPGRPREFFALGFGGNGITFSALASRMIADAIDGRTHPDAALFRLDR